MITVPEPSDRHGRLWKHRILVVRPIVIERSRNSCRRHCQDGRTFSAEFKGVVTCEKQATLSFNAPSSEVPQA
jgi:hypothetical protein